MKTDRLLIGTFQHFIMYDYESLSICSRKDYALIRHLLTIKKWYISNAYYINFDFLALDILSTAKLIISQYLYYTS